MAVHGFFAALVLIVLQFLGVGLLAKNLAPYCLFELALLIIIGSAAIIALIGILRHDRWGWPVMLFVFSASLLNLLWIFIELGSSITIVLSLFIAVCSLLLSFAAMDWWQLPWLPPLDERAMVYHEASAAKKISRRKKSAKKRATRRKVTRKKVSRKKRARRN